MEDAVKKLLCLGICLLMVMFAAESFAGGGKTCIIIKQSTDVTQLKEEINTKVAEGYIPEGISYDGEELYIMYMTEPNTVLEEWSLDVFANNDELKAGLDKIMEKGYFPTGMTANGGNIFLLSTKEKGLKITAYSFINTTWETMENDLKSDFDEGYIPVAIAVDEEGKYFVLMVTIPDTKVSEWNIEEYSKDEYKGAINKKIEEGYFPCGFEMGDDWVHILYIKM
jgi:hypothetical protein